MIDTSNYQQFSLGGESHQTPLANENDAMIYELAARLMREVQGKDLNGLSFVLPDCHLAGARCWAIGCVRVVEQYNIQIDEWQMRADTYVDRS